MTSRGTAPGEARTQALCKELSRILLGALNGSVEAYRLDQASGGYTRWGRVEDDMHAAVRAALSEDGQPREAGPVGLEAAFREGYIAGTADEDAWDQIAEDNAWRTSLAHAAALRSVGPTPAKDELAEKLADALCFTPEQRVRYEAARQRWAKELEPFAEAIRASTQITAEDLALRVGSSVGPTPAVERPTEPSELHAMFKAKLKEAWYADTGPREGKIDRAESAALQAVLRAGAPQVEMRTQTRPGGKGTPIPWPESASQPRMRPDRKGPIHD